ncbi:MAG: nitroreductase family protein [Candidatus Altiarchaeota archaeon]
MGFLDLAKSRRSVRRFTGREVPVKDVEHILEAGRWAPSALNKQPWRFIVITDGEIKSWIRRVYDRVRDELGLYKQDASFLEKSTLIVVLSDTGMPGNEVSTALSAGNILLAAEDMGYGSLIMSSPFMGDEGVRDFKDILGIPDNYKPMFVIAVGCKDGETPVKDRIPLEDLVSYNKYGVG